MALKRELIQFNIINQTDCMFNLSLFQQNQFSVNATTKYTYNVTTIDLSCGTGTIVVNGVSRSISFQPDLTSFLAALNGLGFGFFCSETESGQTYVYTVDDTNVYGCMDVCPSGEPTTTTTTTTTTIPETTTTTTTTTTTVASPTIQLGSASCRNNGCNDNAFCSVIYNIDTTNAPLGSYITVQTDAPPSGASVSIFDNNPASGKLYYQEPNGLEPAVFFTLQLRDSGGNIIATNSTSLTQQSFWQFLPLCDGNTTTTTTTTTVPETTTTTTTTTIGGLTYSTASALDACNAGTPLTGIVFGGGSGLCDSTTIQANEFVGEIAGATVWVSNGVDVREATIDDPNVSGIATFVAACGACSSETTTTTTTTTIPETTTTTTTTTVAILCDEYFNNTGSPITGVNYVDCGGTVFNNQTVDPNQSICVQQGTLNGGDSGFLINLGNCSVTPPESTTTTTTTTLEPPPPTTTTTTTTTTLLSSQLRVENSSLDVVVSDVKVNGVTAPCVTGSYPIPAGENRDLSTTQIGVHSIEVTFTNTITGQNITITDSSLAVQCQTVNISDTFTFPSCNVDGNTQVLIAVQDGACVTP